ncbi:MAG: TetR/AcrR family transcriptional regulator [Bacteroidales bacterium]|nr:TetR/AcrR family transcriptional regulator [Bacteroidales bacterium]MBD5342167.1 TetR/AcrR family transcriptional regulator [Bacteroides sp.]MDE6263119.1 TetR/AcrR family transcriptional regulator [Muribaculaceae bacterium]MBD5351615.1 TetR/AcrR family transcriptional regulator [Bacteroides sp.]MBD5363569.1 TetR/AcrR family transcriptional regulator [Bacteroides sp.]
MSQISTEQKILKAAEAEFLAKGFDGARTTSIARAAGVTHAMLHYYFRSKEKLFQQIISEKFSHLQGIMLSSLLDADKPLMEKISQAIEQHLDFLAANPDLPRFLLTILSGNPELLSTAMSTLNVSGMSSIIQAEIDRNAEAGLCRRIDARMLLLDIVSLNIFSFISAPVISLLLGSFTESPEFIEQRKKNNVEIILNKLRP